MPLGRTVIEFERRNPRLRVLPDEVVIEPVLGCNLRCPMCPVPQLPRSMNGRAPTLMSMGTYRRVVDQISDKPCSILVTMLGEPLLHPRIVDFVALAKARGHHVALITNGTKLTSALTARLLDARLDVLTMSIEGCASDTYESVRVGARQQGVLENLRHLVAENGRRGRPLRIEINYVVSSRTDGEREAFFQAFSPVVDRINFNGIADFGGQFEIPPELLVPGHDPRLISRPPRSEIGPAPAMTRSPCIHLWRSLFVSAEGRLLLCCNDFKLESALPSVAERPLLEIWRTAVQRHRRNHVKGRFDTEPCRSCRQNAVPFRMHHAVRRQIIWKQRAERWLHAALVKPLLPASVEKRRAHRSPPFGHLDVPLRDSTVRGLVDVQGWALGCSGRSIRSVNVRIDGAVQGTAAYGYFRPDVGEIHAGEGNSFSGFSYTLESVRLENGPHTVEVTATDDASDSAAFGARSITVEN